MNDLFAYGKKTVSNRPDEEGAYDSADCKDAAKEYAYDDKGKIDNDTADAEGLMKLVGDNDTHKVVRACSGIGLDHDGHAEG